MQGSQGFTGLQGPTGIQGIIGVQGNVGVQGAQGFTGLQGPTGSQGIIGVQGNVGVQGAQGPTGIQGQTGSQGISGASTSTGATGPTGLVNYNAGIFTGITNVSTIGFTNNGLNWTTKAITLFWNTTNTEQTNGIYSLAYNGNLWVAGGHGSAGAAALAYSSDGTSWLASVSGNSLFGTQTSSAYPCVKSICYSVATNGTIWLAAGANGIPNSVIIYSRNGINWSSCDISSTSFTTQVIGALTWNGSMWMAASMNTGNILAYSYDGIIWANANTTALFGLCCNCIATNGTIWVAGGGNTTNTFAYSYDGFTWIGLGVIIFKHSCTSITWNGAMFVAGGFNAGLPLADALFAYSYDGINWTKSPSGLIIGGGVTSSYRISGIIYNSKLNMWAASSWTTGVFSPYVAYSYNGVDWTIGPAITTGSGYIMNCIANNEPLFTLYNPLSQTTPFYTMNRAQVFLGYITSATIGFTKDSRTWANNPITLFYNSLNTETVNGIYSLAYNGGMWVAGGHGATTANALAYSYDGITWTASSSGTAIFGTASSSPPLNAKSTCYSVATNGTLWLAAGANATPNPVIAYSRDGITWTQCDISAIGYSTNAVLGGLTWNGSMWLVISIFGGAIIGYSYDGILWGTANTTVLFGVSASCMATNGKVWVVGGSQTINHLAYSYDGFRWFGLGTSIWITSCTAIAWNGTIFVAGGNNSSSPSATNLFAYSYDGVNWRASPSGLVYTVSYYVRDIKYSSLMKMWIASVGGPVESIAFSYNGIEWIKGTTSSLAAVCIGVNEPLFTLYNGIAQSKLVTSTISIGYKAGLSNQGVYSIAIGNSAGSSNLYPSSIVINATPNALENTISSGLFIAPMRVDNSIAGSILHYNSTTKEIIYNDITPITSLNYSTMSLLNVSSIKIGSYIYNSLSKANVLIGSLNVSTIARTLDGGNWANNAITLFWNNTNTEAVNGIYSLVYNGGMWVAGGHGATSANALAYSYDGITWTASSSGTAIFGTASSSPPSNAKSTCYSVATNGTIWLAAGANATPNPVIAYSRDGITWTQCDISAIGYTTNAVLGGLTWNGSMWLVISVLGGSIIGYSYDGILWATASTTTFFSVGCACVATNGKIWVIGGTQTINQLIYSYDGLKWFGLGILSIWSGGCSAIAWNGTMFVAGGYPSASLFAYSYDGVNWTASPSGILYTLSYFVRDIKYSKELSTWFAVVSGTTESIAFSFNGIIWNKGATFPTTSMCFGINEPLFTLYDNIAQSKFVTSTVSIGYKAGLSNQGVYSIAIGNSAGSSNLYPSSIVINASPTALENTTLSGLFINPVRNDTTLGQTTTVHYNASTKEITYGNEASDSRLKNNIVQANTELCYSTIESLPLRYFEWNDDFFQHHQGIDKHTLGFIAQEVQPFFPKSISIYSNSFLPNIHSLSMDQIYKSHIGATKQLMAIVKSQQSTIDSLVQRLV